MTNQYPMPIILPICFVLFVTAFSAWAGPPFVTDDPEPVELKHWEVYLASMYNRSDDGTTGTVPHLDANYGPHPRCI